jgi:hypothetical protein
MMSPFDRYRPVRVADSDGGGYVENLVGPTTIWGNLVVHKNEVKITVPANEDVEIGDILIVGNIGVT